MKRLFRRGDPKRDAELAYWRDRREEQGPLESGAPLYRRIFIEHFGLDDSFYEGKRLLDIGCGPRGSLSWAGQAAERVGLDPLVAKYRELQQGEKESHWIPSLSRLYAWNRVCRPFGREIRVEVNFRTGRLPNSRNRFK